MEGFSYQEFLAVDQNRALDFFIEGLVDVAENGVRTDELFYNATVLTHHAHVSCYGEGDSSCPRTLACVFDRDMKLREPEEYKKGFLIDPEVTASQILFMTGFFKERMKHRHNIDWFRRYGAKCYMWASKIADAEGEKSRADTLRRMAINFSFWAERQYWLERCLREKPYLIGLETNGTIN